MASVGSVGSKLTVMLRLPVVPAASRAVTVSTLAPGWSTIPAPDQLVVPVAVPLPPRSLLHVTWVTPTLSVAVPASASGLALVAYVAADVGVVMATVGGAVSGGGAPPTGVFKSAWISAWLNARL